MFSNCLKSVPVLWIYRSPVGEHSEVQMAPGRPARVTDGADDLTTGYAIPDVDGIPRHGYRQV